MNDLLKLEATYYVRKDVYTMNVLLLFVVVMLLNVTYFILSYISSEKELKEMHKFFDSLSDEHAEKEELDHISFLRKIGKVGDKIRNAFYFNASILALSLFFIYVFQLGAYMFIVPIAVIIVTNNMYHRINRFVSYTCNLAIQKLEIEILVEQD